MLGPVDPGERTAVLVIRAWLEPGRTGIRARIVATSDVSRPTRVETAAGSEADVLDAVTRWLRALRPR